MCLDIQVFKLRGSNFPESHDVTTWEEFEESLKHWQTGRPFDLGRRPVAQHAPARIK